MGCLWDVYGIFQSVLESLQKIQSFEFLVHSVVATSEAIFLLRGWITLTGIMKKWSVL